MSNKSMNILTLLIFISFLFVFGQNPKDNNNNRSVDYLKFILERFQNDPDELKCLKESISKRDSSNYVVFALWDWRKSGEISGMPILVKQDTLSKYPYERYVKNYFNKPDRYFSIDVGGQTAGIIKYDRWPNSAGVKFQLIDFDSTKIERARNTHQNYLAIASTFFPPFSIQRKKFGSDIERQNAKTIALEEFKTDGIEIKNSQDIKTIDVQIITPSGFSDTYVYSMFTFLEQQGKSQQLHYLTQLYSLGDSKYHEVFKKHSHFDPNVIGFKGSLNYFFLDVFDYDFDGVDEFLFIESGYEHMDVILYKLKSNELIEIYPVPTSLS